MRAVAGSTVVAMSRGYPFRVRLAPSHKRNLHNASMPAPTILACAVLACADLTPLTTFSKPDGAIKAMLAGVDAPCELVLLDRDAVELARATAAPGEVDLAAIFPPLRDIARAVRVQAIVEGTAQGAPLLVIPLLPRPAIRTITDTRPDGTSKFTRVIGFGDELLDPSNAEHVKAKESWTKSDPTPRSGFRLARDFDVVFETTAGMMRFAMRPDEAPNSARNFVELADSGFYNGTLVHRIVPADRNGIPFVIQGGDPTGTGDGGPGYDLPLEPSKLAHDFGVLSMARSDWPDSAGSQWFVGLSRQATARLDGQYCAFGYAVKGADAIMRISDGEIADPATGRPKTPETVTRAFIVLAPAWTPGVGRPDVMVTRPAVNSKPVELDR